MSSSDLADTHVPLAAVSFKKTRNRSRMSHLRPLFPENRRQQDLAYSSIPKSARVRLRSAIWIVSFNGISIGFARSSAKIFAVVSIV